MKKHAQVPFTTLKGQVVEVDEGLHDILAMLRGLGVETQYSCQGSSTGAAYVLANRRGMRRLVREIYARYLKGEYTPEIRELIENFRKGLIEHEFAHFPEPGSGRAPRQWIYRRGRKKAGWYAMEWLYSRRYGLRVSIRWPQDRNDDVFKLLFETYI